MVAEKELLRRIKQTVLKESPFAKIYLYGSHARGNSRPDSDWDIVILVNTDKVTFDLEKKITTPLYDLEFETGEVISPLIYSENEWNSRYRITPFYANVMREALQL